VLVQSRSPLLTALAFLSIAEGVFFLGYAVFDVVGVLRFGLTGPEEVSNAPALTLQVLMFALFGAALILVARGWWGVKRWARAPFVLAQLLVLVVAVPLTSASGSVERIAASIGVLMAVVGLVLTFLPSTTRALLGEDSP
jgi:hypothetical protein